MAYLQRTGIGKLTFSVAIAMATACGGGSASTTDAPRADSPGGQQGTCAQTTPLARLAACSTGASGTIDVPSGCTPTTDGTLHQEEWSDAACIALGSSGDVVSAKYSGDNLYLAFSATPACGCGMSFVFDPNNGGTLDGDEFGIIVFDDPFNKDGDRTDYVVSGGNWTSGSAPSGITTACPGNTPSPINYEWKIPFSALGITAGSAHSFHFAVDHPSAGVWPANLILPPSSNLSVNPSSWGELSSSASWH